MSAEQLIALEAALAEVSTLYAAARSFAALRHRADTELLPQLLALGGRLRAVLRVASLSPAEVDVAANEILSLRAAWRLALEEVRASSIYAAAQAALAADGQEDLACLLPQIFAGLEVVRPIPTLFFPLSPSSGQRRPGSSPFLSAAACADRIVQTLADGIELEVTGSEWWDREWPCVVCAADPEALDTPLTLRVVAAQVRWAVFTVADEPTLRIFTHRVRASMSVAIAAEATDEWWLAYEDSYGAFRDALKRELAVRGVPVSG